MIKKIIEKYNKHYESNGLSITREIDCIHPNDFPALERDLSQLLEDTVCDFTEWTNSDYCPYYQYTFNGWLPKDVKKFDEKTTSELYALFLTNKNKTDEQRDKIQGLG